MELYQEVLKNIFLEQNGDNLCMQSILNDLVEMKCYQALKKIKEIIDDDRLDDKECFMKIEEIICVLEELGSGGGTRHDFG